MVNRLYGFRPKERPQYMGTDSVVNPGDIRTTPPGTPVVNKPTTEEQPYHSGPSAESDDGNNAADVRSAASQDLGYDRGIMTPGQIAANLVGIASPIPGLGMVANYLGLPDSVDRTLGTEAPFGQAYGDIGTIGTEGGVFGADGREYDPITGRGLNSYANTDAFKSGSYVQGIFDNPFSIDSYLSDPDNAYNYNRTNTGRGLEAQGFQFGIDRGAFAADEDLGTLPTQAERDRLAQHVGQTEYGFEEHTVAPDTATNQAIQGQGYTGSGAAPAGSQFSSTGTFSSSHSDDSGPTGPGGNPNTVSDEVTDDLADEDFGSYDDGGGGGGGK